jgi:uncharacterized membrane protein YqjE
VGIKNKLSDMFKLGEIKDKVIELIEAKFELKKLEIQEKAERGMAELIFSLGLIIFLAVILVFVLHFIAFGLNVWLGEPYGDVVILVFLLVSLIIIYIRKDDIKDMIRKTIEKELDAMDS